MLSDSIGNSEKPEQLISSYDFPYILQQTYVIILIFFKQL